MGKIILVGSAGFVGSNISNYYIQHTNHQLSGYDNLYNHDLRNLQPSVQSKSRFSFYLAKEEDDYIRQKTLDVERPDIVIYNMFQHNYRMTGQKADGSQAMSLLLKWVADAKLFGCKKFIVIGSPDLFYKTPTQEQREYVNLCENILHDPSFDGMNRYLMLFSELYGPRQNPEASLPGIFISALKGETREDLSDIPIDRLYVKDLFNNVNNIVDSDIDSGMYVFRSQEATSESDVMSYISAMVSGEDVRLNVSKRKDPSVCGWMQTDPIYLSWEPNYKLDRAIEHTFCWYDINRWAWRE